MIMPQGLRKAMLTAHVMSSIGWFGAVAAFLALALTGTMSQDPEAVRAVYLVLGVTTWWAIVPLALLAVVTGIVSSLFTKWGLFRYYWVLVKLVITAGATFGLLEHATLVNRLAGVAARTAVLGSTLAGARQELVTDAAGGLVVLLLLTVLSVYKLRGLTPYGQRKQDEQHQGDAASHDQVQESELEDASIPVQVTR
jgi:hypothetical protein